MNTCAPGRPSGRASPHRAARPRAAASPTLVLAFLAATFWICGFLLAEEEEKEPIKPAGPEPLAPEGQTPRPGARLLMPAEETGEELPAAAEETGQREKAPVISPALAAAIAREEKLRRDKDSVKWGQVVAAYRAVVDAEPNNAEARYRLGLALARAGKPGEGCSELERALVLSPDEPRYLMDFGTLAAQMGQFQKALGACAKAVQTVPGSARACNALGNVCLAAGDHPKAVAAYRSAVRLAPQNPRYIHNLGRAYLSGGEFKMAVQVLDEVLRLDRKCAEAFNDRATAFRELKELRRAITDLQQAVSLKPDFALAHYNLSQLYLGARDVSFTERFGALDHAQSAVKLTERKEPLFLMGLAEAFSLNRDFDKAVQAAREATLLDPRKDYLDQLAKYEQLQKQGFLGTVPP